MNTSKHEGLLYKDLSYEIQGAAIEARKNFGSGHKESLYQNAFAEELESRNVSFEKERSIKIYSPKTGRIIGYYRPDFIIEDKIIVELKAVEKIPQMIVNQLYDYLRNSEYELGYFINFSSPRLYIKRIIFTNDRKFSKFKNLLAVLGLIWVFFSVSPAEAAQLFFETRSQDAYLNQQFEVVLKIDPEGQSINAIEGKIAYPDTLRLISINDGDSVIGLWVQKPIQKDQGVVFSGIIPGGYAGDLGPDWSGPRPGKIISLIFTARGPGLTNINLEDTRVLLNDGRGTAAPLKNYNLENLRINNEARPSEIAPADTTPPEEFNPIVARDPNIFNDKWFLAFKARDTKSGIDHYEVLENHTLWDFRNLFERNNWAVAESPHELQDQRLQSVIFVKAVDRRGNERIEKLQPRNPLSWYENYLYWFIIIVAGIIVIYLIYRTRAARFKR